MTSKPLESYLAPRPRGVAWKWLLTTMLLAPGIWFGMQAWEQSGEASRLAHRHAGLLEQQAARVVPAPSRQQVDEQKQWAQLQLERDFPWNKVFRAIERTANPDIELLEFHPDKLNRAIALSGEARNLESLLAYLRSLSAKSDWSDVHLVHQQTVQHDKLVTVSFEIKATLPN